MFGSAITSAEILVHGHVKMIEIAVTRPKKQRDSNRRLVQRALTSSRTNGFMPSSNTVHS